MGKGTREVRRRHEIAAQGFRQAADQFGDFFCDEARHQPVAACGGNGVDEGQRHLQGDAVGGIARHEAIVQLERVTGKFQRSGKIAGTNAGLVRQNEIQRPAQCGPLHRRCLAVPRVECGGGVDVCRQLAGEKFHQFIFALDQATAPPLGLDLMRLSQHACVGACAIGAAIDLATHQCLAHEHGMRQRRILHAELHAALFHQHQTKQRDLLERQYRATPTRPVWVAPAALDQMRSLLLDPFRLDERAQHSVYFLQVDDLSRHHPRRHALGQHRSRKDLEFALARAAILATLVLVPNLGWPAGKQAAMDGVVA